MADKVYTQHSREQQKTITLGKYALTIKATVSENDTVTVAELSSIDTVKAVILETGAECAVSEATNVITVTEVITDKEVIFLVVGDKV